MPSSSARSMIAWESASEVSGPKFIVPRQSRLTRSPVRPRCAYCIEAPRRSAGDRGKPRRAPQVSGASGERLEDVLGPLEDLRREHLGLQRAADQVGQEAGNRRAVLLVAGGPRLDQ